MMIDENRPCQATPAEELERQITNSTVPKNEREWWAAGRIATLKAQLAASEAAREKAEAGVEFLKGAIGNVLVGGNHLALHVGASPPSPSTPDDDALEQYGPGIQYDVWVAWAEIMKLARAVSALTKDTTDAGIGDASMSDKEGDKRVEEMMNLIPPEWDRKPIILAHEIRKFLEAVKDKGTSIDSGGGDGSADLWVKIEGIEYYINIRPSKPAQL